MQIILWIRKEIPNERFSRKEEWGSWERGYKCGQADREEPVEAEHKICIGDAVITPLGLKGIVIGIGEKASGIWASVYLKEFDVPQMELLYNLKYTGKHIDITNIFEQLFNCIKGDKENENS